MTNPQIKNPDHVIVNLYTIDDKAYVYRATEDDVEIFFPNGELMEFETFRKIAND